MWGGSVKRKSGRVSVMQYSSMAISGRFLTFITLIESVGSFPDKAAFLAAAKLSTSSK
jgi:hypothetical protein